MPAIVDILTCAGIRATPKRQLLVKALLEARGPKTIEEIHARVRSMDLVTVYRNIEALVRSGFVHEVRFKDAPVRFEWGRSHHHHVVCTECGVVDELDACTLKGAEKRALRHTSNFASIDEHVLEFYGTCVSCARRSTSLLR